MKQPDLTVVKVGGSLFDWPELAARLSAFLDARRQRRPSDRIVAIAGGGRAVDVIRTLDQIHRLGDETSHQLALYALDLTSIVLAALVPGSILVERIELLSEAWKGSATPILSPRRALEEIEVSTSERLIASWNVTSDTIAARIAVHLEAECLILLKSAPLPASSTHAVAARLGVVDPMLAATAGSLLRVEYLNLRGKTLEPCLLLP